MKPGFAAYTPPRLPAALIVWPATELETGVCKLAEHVCSFVETWRNLPSPRLESKSLHEVQLVVFRLTRKCANKLQKLSTEAAAYWAQTRKLATPHLYCTVLEALQALLSVPASRVALNEERLAKTTEAGAAQQSAAQALLEALAYQRCSCGLTMMCGQEDTADQLDELLRQVLLAFPLPSALKLLSLTSRGAFHLCSAELQQPGAPAEEGTQHASHASRAKMNQLVARAVGYLTAQMTLIHASLPPDALAQPLNERLAALHIDSELHLRQDQRIWGELRAALRGIAREWAIVGGYPQYSLAKEIFASESSSGDCGGGAPAPLLNEMRRALGLSKDSSPARLLDRLQQILRRCVYSDTEPAAMLALHDFQVHHGEWLEQHLEEMPLTRYKLLLEFLVRRAAGARRVDPAQECPLSPAGNYANTPAGLSRGPAPSSASRASRLPKPASQPALAQQRPRASALRKWSTG